MLLGHSSVQVTEQRYAFLEAERVASEVAGMKPGTARIEVSQKSHEIGHKRKGDFEIIMPAANLTITTPTESKDHSGSDF
jgi:hypothetical protein